MGELCAITRNTLTALPSELYVAASVAVSAVGSSPHLSASEWIDLLLPEGAGSREPDSLLLCVSCGGSVPAVDTRFPPRPTVLGSAGRALGTGSPVNTPGSPRALGFCTFTISAPGLGESLPWPERNPTRQTHTACPHCPRRGGQSDLGAQMGVGGGGTGWGWGAGVGCLRLSVHRVKYCFSRWLPPASKRSERILQGMSVPRPQLRSQVSQI